MFINLNVSEFIDARNRQDALFLLKSLAISYHVPSRTMLSLWG